MDGKKILFVVRDIGISIQACIQSIRRLSLPDEYKISTVTWRESNFFHIYNNLLRTSDAQYKVYLDSNLAFQNECAIEEMLQIFQSNENIGMIGLLGSEGVDTSLDFDASQRRLGGIVDREARGTLKERRFEISNEAYTSAQVLNGMFLAVSKGFLVNGSPNGTYVPEFLSMEFRRHDYEVVVPRQEKLWCIREGIVVKDKLEDRLEFCRRYAPYALQESEIRPGKIFSCFGDNVHIEGILHVEGMEKISIGDRVQIGKEVSLKTYGVRASLRIGEDSRLGAHSIIEAKGEVCLEDFVSLGEGAKIYGYAWRAEHLSVPSNVDKMPQKVHVGRGA